MPDGSSDPKEEKVLVIHENLEQIAHLFLHQIRVVDIEISAKELAGHLLLEPLERASLLCIKEGLLGNSMLIALTGLSCSLKQPSNLPGDELYISCLSIMEFVYMR